MAGFKSESTLCPFCKEEIAVGAIKCKHCYSDLTSSSDELPSASGPYTDVVEYNESGVGVVVAIVWILYLFTFALGITAVIGMLAAFAWRWETPQNSLYRNHFDSQIRLFFKALLFLSIWFGMIFIVFMTGQLQFGFILDLHTSFSIMVLGIGGYVFIMSVIGLVKLLGKKPYNMPVPKAAE